MIDQHKQLNLIQVAITNNCSSFIDMARKFKKEYKSENNLKDDSEADKVFENVLSSFDNLREER
jgi:hypothetical protein